MSIQENTDLYICAVLTQMVTARAGDVKMEFQAVVSLMNHLRGYQEEEVLILLQAALEIDRELDFDSLIKMCKDQLSDEQIRECVGLLAYLARIDGDVSAAEEEIFTKLCVGLGVSMNDGKVEIMR
jgi:uncharacterized tellurite resistance protein B-like protein